MNSNTLKLILYLYSGIINLFSELNFYNQDGCGGFWLALQLVELHAFREIL